MPIFMFLVLSFGLGFSLALILLGTNEKKLVTRISELEGENHEFKVKYLGNCWNGSTKDVS